MGGYWEQDFRRRMMGFAARRPPHNSEVPVSIKIRVASGCFHREHSPHAYVMIDSYLASLDADGTDFAFEEHESGPEILVYLAVTTAGIMLAKSVIDLVTAIVNARAEGIRQGDRPSDPLTLIIRRIRRNGEFEEEEVMRFEAHQPIDKARIEELLNSAARSMLNDETPDDG